MYRKYPKLISILVIISLNMFSIMTAGYASTPIVNLMITPDNTEIYTGSGAVIITTQASSTKLTYTWNVLGPGKIKGGGPAVMYIPPDQIDRDSLPATVSVIVADENGQEATATVALTILKRLTQAQPIPTQSVSKGRSSNTTLIVGGAAALAALGGGVALLVGGKEEGSSCGGTEVGGYCWYLGSRGASCSNVCAPHGGYHDATRFYVGSEGTDENCWNVLEALKAPRDSDGLIYTGLGSNIGCHYWIGSTGSVYWTRYTASPTGADSVGYSGDQYRACACNQ